MAELSELKKAGLKGAYWNFLTTIISQLRGFVVSIVLARLLLPEDFGIVAVALVFNGIIEALIDFGFSNAIVQKKDVTQVQKSTIFYVTILLGGTFTLILFVCAPLMAHYFRMPILNQVVRFTSFSFVIASFSNLQVSLFQKELDFKSPFKARWIASVTSGAIGIILAVTGCKVWALVISNLASWVLNSAIVWFLSTWRPSCVFSLRSISSLWDYGWKLTLTTFTNRIFVQIDTFVIGKLFSATILGYFNRAQALNRMIVDCSFSSIRNVLLPTYSKIQDEQEKLRTSTLKLVNIASFLNFFLSGLMYVCANDIILLLYGVNWQPAVLVFKILALFSLQLSIPSLYDGLLLALGKMNMYFWANFVRKPVMLLAIPVGILYGFIPYIWVATVLNFVSIASLIWAVKKCINLDYSVHLENIFKYAVPFVGLVVLSEYVKVDAGNSFLNLSINATVYISVYLSYCALAKYEGYTICLNVVSTHIFNRLKRRKETVS